MADCTIKDYTQVWHDQLHVCLFSSEKHLKLVVWHLSTVLSLLLILWTTIVYSYKDYAMQVLLLCFIYIYIYIHIYIYIYIIYVYVYICILRMYIHIHILCIYIYIYIYIMRWCPLIHLFHIPFQNSPYGHGM